MEKQAPLGSQIALAGVMLLLGWGLGQWTWLKGLHWWYPSTSGHELWWLWWIGLYLVGAWALRSRPQLRPVVLVLWFATTVFALSGLWNIIDYINVKFTVGDLHLNHFRGAQRAFRGDPIYDVSGLFQSVNASPFIIALLRPFGGVTTRAFLPYWLAGNVAFLCVFFLYAWLWTRWIWAQAGRRPGLPEFGLLVASTVTFNSFQRSLRLGQLDIIVVMLVAAGTYHVLRAAHTDKPRTQALHGILGGLFTMLALGVKVVPGLLLATLGFWLLLALASQRDALSWRRLGAIGGGVVLGGLLIVNLSLAWIGPKEVGRFFENIPKMNRGSSAGVNFALVGRFAKYKNAKLRLRHAPLPKSHVWWIGPLRVLFLLWLGLLAWRLPVAWVPFLMLFGLACLPMLSPMCWDIYFIWCALFPWWLMLMWTARDWAPDPDTSTPQETSAPLSPKEKAAASVKRLRMLLFGALGFGSFYLMGLAGNSVIRDLRTLRLIDLKLPLWFDEARVLGWVLLLVWLSVHLVGLRQDAATSSDPEALG